MFTKKNVLKKALTVVTALALVAVSAVALPATKTKAASGNVTVFFQNSKNWSSVYCYTFTTGMTGGKVGATFPGTQMKSVGNGWFSYTYTASSPLNVIFSDGENKNQTGNNDPADLPLDPSAYWFTISGGTAGAAGFGSGGLAVTQTTTPQAGWPTVGAADATTATSSAAASTKGATSSKAATKKGSSTPSTGDAGIVIPSALLLIGVSGLVAAKLAKKTK